MANLLMDLAAALANKGDAIPPGWKSANEWSEECGFKSSRARQLLAAGVAAGKVERRVFRVLMNGVPRAIPHYKVIS